MSENRSKLCTITPVIMHSKISAQTVKVNPVPAQADNDTHVLNLWLHGRSRHTQRAYHTDIKRFLNFTNNKPLHQITLGDLQQFSDSLTQDELESTSQHRIIASIKSLFAFAHKLGYLPFDVARPLQCPRFKETLSERILSEAQVQKIIGLEPHLRNQLLLRLLYAGGLRVSEIGRLTWKDLQERGQEGGQMTIYGKGAKTHVVLITNPLWQDLMEYRKNAIETDPIFKSRKGGALDSSQILRIVKKAAKRAGIGSKVSPHWFRHAHASHALDHGAPIHLVQATLAHSSIATTGKYTHARPTESSSKYLTV